MTASVHLVWYKNITHAILLVGVSMKVSVSSLEQYERCPKQYYLERIEKSKGYPEAPKRLGRVVHRTIEQMLRTYKEVNWLEPFAADVLYDTFVEEWNKENALNNKKLFTEGLQMASDWMRRWDMLDPKDIIGIEQPFEIDFGSFELIGYIDLALAWQEFNEETGEVVKNINIFDWKTSNVFMSTRDAQESFQLAVYDIAAREIFDDADFFDSCRYRTTIEMLRDGTRLEVRHTDEELELTKRYIEVTVEKIRLDDEWKAILNPDCIYCAHKYSCEEHQKALRANDVPYCQDMHQLEILAIEREQLSIRRKIINERIDKIDNVLKTHITATSEPLNIAGHFFKISKRRKKIYPPDIVVPLLVKKLGLDARDVLSEVSSINPKKLKDYLENSTKTFGNNKISMIRSTLENTATTIVTPQLYHRKEKSKKQ